MLLVTFPACLSSDAKLTQTTRTSAAESRRSGPAEDEVLHDLRLHHGAQRLEKLGRGVLAGTVAAGEFLLLDDHHRPAARERLARPFEHLQLEPLDVDLDEVDLVASLKEAGIAVLADYSDDHFSNPERGEAYRALANAVDRAVASTPGLAEVIAQHSPVPVSVITDPVEGARGEPRAPEATPLRLLWFGHPSNLDTLQYALPQLQGLPVSVTLITAPRTGAEQLGARFRPWSTQAVFDELRQCDAVFIPSNPYDPRKAVKSPNRFTESVWAGRFVLAHPLPAYQELADFGWVGEDLGEGVRWLGEHRDQALERIERGQAAIAERFSPRAVGAAWKEAILLARARA